jgi:hypothetical protein
MPWLPVRTVDGCPFRISAMSGQSVEQARCRLLIDTANVALELVPEIGREVCEACCRSFTPTIERHNPVTASLMAELAGNIRARGGVPGCNRKQAAQLLEAALRELSFDRERISTEADSAPKPLISRESFVVTVPMPSRRCGSRIKTWAVGITTAPRRQPTLEPCLRSLRAAGWDTAYLFVDGPVVPPSDLKGITTIVRETPVGAWSNYWLTLSELLLRQPQADAFMIVQDDALFDPRPGMKGYLDELLWPGTSLGIVSLYGSSEYTIGRTSGWSVLPEAWVWGAVAFIFPRELAKRFVTDPHVFEHRWSKPTKDAGNPAGGSPAGIDIVVGQWAKLHEIPVWFPTPSLVQHIGHASSIWSDTQAAGSRRATRFSGDQ